jgi:hypothetical protein
MTSIRVRLGRVRHPPAARDPDFAWLWIGMTVSMVGDGIYIVAVAWQVYQLSNTPTALAAVGIAWSLPQIILLLAPACCPTVSTAVTDDRRRRPAAGRDRRRGGALPQDELTIPLLIGLVVVYGVGQALFGPAFSSIVAEHRPVGVARRGELARTVRPAVRHDARRTADRRAAGGERRRRVGVHRRRADVRVLGRDDHVDPRAPTERDPEDDASFWADTKEGIRYVKERTGCGRR